MKKFITTFLATVLLAASAQACLGGNLLQVMTEDEETVIATYNINSGELLAQNKSYSIDSMNVYDQSVGEIHESICAGDEGHCKKLADVDRQDIVVRYSTYSQGKLVHGSRVIENVSVGAHAPISRGMSKGMLDLLNPIACAKK